MVRQLLQTLTVVIATAVVAGSSVVHGGADGKRLDLYFIDVEGGAATLIAAAVFTRRLPVLRGKVREFWDARQAA